MTYCLQHKRAEMPETILRELEKLSYGWDNFGGEEITPASLERTRELIDQLIAKNIEIEQIRPTITGGVYLEWFRNKGKDDSEHTLEITETGHIYGYRSHGTQPLTDEEAIGYITEGV